MDRQQPTWTEAVYEAEWIAARLALFRSHIVASVVPDGFASYVRVLHPVEVPGNRVGGRLVRWADVASWSGAPLRSDSQFHSVALPPLRPEAPAPWRSQGPGLGTLYLPDAMVLAEVLRRFTATPDECWFCLWEGYDLRGTPLTAPGEPSVPWPDPLPSAVRNGPRVRLPNRDYLLYGGSVEDVVAPVPAPLGRPAFSQTANLWWPSDRAWAVASEIDLSSTYVGGSSEMAAALLADDRIEVLLASPDDPLSRIEDWVQAWVDDAVNELLRSGEASIATSAGTLYMRPKQPSRLRHGALWISQNPDLHDRGFTRLSRSIDVDPRSVVSASVSWAVIGLVGR